MVSNRKIFYFYNQNFLKFTNPKIFNFKFKIITNIFYSKFNSNIKQIKSINVCVFSIIHLSNKKHKKIQLIIQTFKFYKLTGATVYVNNLSRRIKEDEIQDKFSKSGKILFLNIVRDPFTKYKIKIKEIF